MDEDPIKLLTDIPSVHAAARGGHVAVEFEGRQLTYAELDRRSDAVAGLLQQAGVRFCLDYEGDQETAGSRNLAFIAGTAAGHGLVERAAQVLGEREVAARVVEALPAVAADGVRVEPLHHG